MQPPSRKIYPCTDYKKDNCNRGAECWFAHQDDVAWVRLNSLDSKLWKNDRNFQEWALKYQRFDSDVFQLVKTNPFDDVLRSLIEVSHSGAISAMQKKREWEEREREKKRLEEETKKIDAQKANAIKMKRKHDLLVQEDEKKRKGAEEEKQQRELEETIKINEFEKLLKDLGEQDEVHYSPVQQLINEARLSSTVNESSVDKDWNLYSLIGRIKSTPIGERKFKPHLITKHIGFLDYLFRRITYTRDYASLTAEDMKGAKNKKLRLSYNKAVESMKSYEVSREEEGWIVFPGKFDTKKLPVLKFVFASWKEEEGGPNHPTSGTTASYTAPAGGIGSSTSGTTVSYTAPAGGIGIGSSTSGTTAPALGIGSSSSDLYSSYATFMEPFLKETTRCACNKSEPVYACNTEPCKKENNEKRMCKNCVGSHLKSNRTKNHQIWFTCCNCSELTADLIN